MTITVVFDPPIPSDSPATFNAKAFTLLGDLNTWSTQANAMPASFASSVSAALAAPPAIGGTTPAAGSFTTLSASGNVLVISPGGGLGYGTGAGGTVTQATSKTTAVTLNKPIGRITTHNASLAAGATVSFSVNNSLVDGNSVICVNLLAAGTAQQEAYIVRAGTYTSGVFFVSIKNDSASPLSEALNISFAVLKGVIT